MSIKVLFLYINLTEAHLSIFKKKKIHLYVVKGIKFN